MKRLVALLVALNLLLCGAVVAQGSLLGAWQRLSDNWSLVEFASGNSGATVRCSSGSCELRVCVTNAGVGRPCWRVLGNGTGGIEIQNASSETFADAANVLSIANQQNTNVAPDTAGLNLDVNNLSGRFMVRAGESSGSVDLGGLRAAPNSANGFTTTLQARDNTGTLRDSLWIDPGADSTGDVAVRFGSAGVHRLRRELINGRYLVTAD